MSINSKAKCLCLPWLLILLLFCRWCRCYHFVILTIKRKWSNRVCLIWDIIIQRLQHWRWIQRINNVITCLRISIFIDSEALWFIPAAIQHIHPSHKLQSLWGSINILQIFWRRLYPNNHNLMLLNQSSAVFLGPNLTHFEY